MAIQIRNRARHAVTIELNTRETIHLAPGEASRPIEQYEVRDNLQLQKLINRNEVESLGEEGPSPAAGGKARRSKGTAGE